MKHTQLYKLVLCIIIFTIFGCEQKQNQPSGESLSKNLSSTNIAQECLNDYKQTHNLRVNISDPPNNFADYQITTPREIVLKAWEAGVKLLISSESEIFQLNREYQELRFGDKHVHVRYDTQFINTEEFFVAGDRNKIPIADVVGGQKFLTTVRSLSKRKLLIAANTGYIGKNCHPVMGIHCWRDGRLFDPKIGLIMTMDRVPSDALDQLVQIAETIDENGKVLRKWWFQFEQ